MRRVAAGPHVLHLLVVCGPRLGARFGAERVDVLVELLHPRLHIRHVLGVPAHGQTFSRSVGPQLGAAPTARSVRQRTLRCPGSSPPPRRRPWPTPPRKSSSSPRPSPSPLRSGRLAR